MNKKRILTTISCLLLVVDCWFLAISYVLAADYKLEVPFTKETITGPASYIHYLFIWGLGMVGLVALVAVAYGGFVYLVSGGSETTKSYAKEIIWGAIYGLLLLFCSYLILHTINPDLVKLKLETTPVSLPSPPTAAPTPGVSIPVTTTPTTPGQCEPGYSLQYDEFGNEKCILIQQ